MTERNYTTDGWAYEPADRSVGIMQGGWYHEACPVRDANGTTDEQHVDDIIVLTCRDCGASTEVPA